MYTPIEAIVSVCPKLVNYLQDAIAADCEKGDEIEPAFIPSQQPPMEESFMEDYEIIVKILNRDQAGLDQAEQQYGDACRAVAIRILGDDRSAEMVVREAFLRAWETIPKQQPKNLKTYLLRITRNLAVEHSPRDGEYDRVLQELDRCVSGQSEGFDAPCNTKALLRAMDEFLSGLAPAKRKMFVLRYWYVCSVEEISKEALIKAARADSERFCSKLRFGNPRNTGCISSCSN